MFEKLLPLRNFGIDFWCSGNSGHWFELLHIMCQVLHITKSRHPAQHIYILHGQALEAADHAKYLGMDISKDLSWNTHINRITANANMTLGFLRNIKTQHTGIRTAAYSTLVHPQVEYASPVWSPYT